MPDRARIGLRDALAAALAIHATPFNDGLTNADKHRPGFDNTTLVTSNHYNTADHLVRTESSSADGVYAVTLYEYDPLGTPLLTCQDLDLDGAIDPAGPDRVTGSASRYLLINSDWWHQTASLSYGGTSVSPLTNALSRTRLTGLGGSNFQHPAFAIQGATLTAETHAIDHLGHATTSRTFIDRDYKTVFHITTHPASTQASGTITVNGLLEEATGSSGHTTAYAYDTLGRTIAVTNALGQVTRNAYDPQGRVIATWGNTYPVAYEYDHSGRMTAMATTRDGEVDFAALAVQLAAGVSLTSIGSIWSLDLTQWQYHEPTGLLTNKLYADGKGTSYSYTPDGKLASRTWSRGITTTYCYDTAQNLTSISYGRSSVSALTRTYDHLGRPAGLSLSGSPYAIAYAYDEYGRFNNVSSFASLASLAVQYSYLPNTDLLSGYTAGDFTRTVSYEPYRSLITSVENKHGSTTISQYDYTNDQLGRRTAISRSGVAFGNTPVRDAYGHNLRSEVTSARRTLASNPSQEVRGTEK